MRARVVVATLALALAIAVGAPAQADNKSYLRGYLNALLDSRFPGLGLRVRALSAEGGVRLHSASCLGPWQRRAIADLIHDTGRVTTVTWDNADPCAAGVASGEIDPDAFDVRALPEQAMFAPLLADPRQPRFSMSYQRYEIGDAPFNAGSVAFGEYFGLAAGFLGKNGSSQIGIQGAVFALFNLDGASNDLVNADYWIGLPISYRRGRDSYLLRLYHQSSHLGDEFLLGNPNIARINLSYEDAELLASYEWEHARIYGGVGYILNSEPEIARSHARVGAEWVQPRALKGFDLLVGTDVQASAELDWSQSRAYQAGFELRRGTNRRVRLMFEHFNGHSPHGQFFREKLRYNGFGLYFGF